jgi:hypothetical protein
VGPPLPRGPALITAPLGQSVWFSITNTEDSANQKWVQLTLAGGPRQALGIRKKDAIGAGPDGSRIKAKVLGTKLDDTNNRMTYTWKFPSCPQWERLRFKPKNNSFSGGANVTVAASSWCAAVRPALAALIVEDAFFGGLASQVGSTRVTEIWAFPHSRPIDDSVAATFSADATTGAWQSTFVSQDPYGQPREQRGVRWMSEGPGIGGEDKFGFSFSMFDSADLQYDIYFHSAELEEHTHFAIDLSEPKFMPDEFPLTGQDRTVTPCECL